MPRQYYNHELGEFDYLETEEERVREWYRLEAERKEELRQLDREEGEE